MMAKQLLQLSGLSVQKVTAIVKEVVNLKILVFSYIIDNSRSVLLLSMILLSVYFLEFFFLKIKLLLAIRKLDTGLPIITGR